MSRDFPLFSSPIDLAHSYWEKLLQEGDSAIDATCGNGKDTLMLAELIIKKGSGHLFGLDIQKDAIEKTLSLLQEKLNPSELDRVHLYCSSHETFPISAYERPIKLIVYNLGYLPGGDKSLTTLTHTTKKSIKEALALIVAGGAISITCYPGHPEGAIEEIDLLAYASTLDPKRWSVCHHNWSNRSLSPSLLFIQKSN